MIERILCLWRTNEEAFRTPEHDLETSKHRRPLKELWHRLLGMDELEEVTGGGEPKPITTGGGC